MTVTSVSRTGSLLSWAEDELRVALERSALLDPRSYEIFGQGSRVNDTFIEPGSDIDLVLMLKTPFAYGWEQFRDDVLAALSESFDVRMGRRCLNVDDPASLFGEMVDILVATEFRLPTGPGTDEQGVFFRDREGRPIVNFPKRHRRNGDAKELRTRGGFKAAVRTAKRARIRAGLSAWDAPSYLLECLLHNVPDGIYRGPDPYRAALDWLRRCDPAAFAELPCQNGINHLFGPGPDQWEPATAGRIIDVLHEI
ncbi:hypothetical protein Acy02nite_33220 [Actinoplanes cyaneus]|uniref:cGAS/DncV-like nucleotidyltransferase C-terminal helical domain-containing protein n=1 Tax=Actinoplanes cyaneus TaxID=52696 RepID=A0A919IJ53_9ACTN|nr:hypothetical protein [Actinoplanes cyaneus]MCW2140127.1 hypothetical protein [Actinoplanes cyaneus]GID65441.1 hypothetical protein Acy02nite_33220 [Actinoplanes cyaneus]